MQRKNPGPAKKPLASALFYVTMVEKDHESGNYRQIEVGEKSVTIWLAEGSENEVKTRLWSDTLPGAARDSLEKLVQACGLDTLKESYTNPAGIDGRDFLFSIWDVKKETSTVCHLKNCWVPSLYELGAFINSLLPKQYAMNLSAP